MCSELGYSELGYGETAYLVWFVFLMETKDGFFGGKTFLYTHGIGESVL
jgi:hypothetical protein